MDLQDPTAKMSKSSDSPPGHDPACSTTPRRSRKKIKRAVTDTDTEVRFDPEAKPGVSNLLSILAAATGADPGGARRPATRSTARSRPTRPRPSSSCSALQARYAELAADPGEVARLLGVGRREGRRPAATTLARAKSALGLLPASPL